MHAIKTKARLNRKQYINLREMTYNARILRNKAINKIDTFYDENKTYLNHNKLRHIMKSDFHYKQINSNMAQEVLKSLDFNYKSFFKLLKNKKDGIYNKVVNKPKINYENKYSALYINKSQTKINSKRNFTVPAPRGYYKNHEKIILHIPNCVDISKLKQIQIIPKNKAKFFAIHFIVDDEQIEVKNTKTTCNALAIDYGINNFASCVNSNGNTFIIDGLKLKSDNIFFFKEYAKIQRLKKKQNYNFITRRQFKLMEKHDNIVDNFIKQTSRYIINYCIENNIDTIIVGYNTDFQQKAILGNKINQIFTSHQFGKSRKQIKYLCSINNIKYVEQEESYTSKASFFDNDDIPVYDKNDNKKHTFSGSRITRGNYKTSNNKIINADINGALNIMKKSKLIDDKINILQSKSCVNQPKRIRVV